MNTQFDHRTRIVSIDNLYAMCEHISGICHTFTVTKVSRSRVHVEYSNPNEYGTPHPVTAVYPCYPQHNTTAIVLDAMRYTGISQSGVDSEDWQAFEQLYACPTLWMSDGRWETHAEIANRLQSPDETPWHRGDYCACTVCDLPEVSK